ncbi:Heme/hemopexin transporter protein HuxB precursor [compost metagenome]
MPYLFSAAPRRAASAAPASAPASCSSPPGAVGARIPLRWVFAACAMSYACAGAAQLIPNAGDALRGIEGPRPALEPSAPPVLTRPPAQTDAPRSPAGDEAGATVIVSRYDFEQNTVFDETTLRALLDDTLHTPQSFQALQAAAARITAFYHERGYVLARAYLPPQEIENGRVRIRVAEGRYDQIVINNTSRVRDAVLARPLAPLRRDTPLQAGPLERSLLLLSDLPGVEVSGTLRPAGTQGATDLVVDVAPGPMISGSVEADNHGGLYTGEHRLGGSLDLSNPLALGDQASIRLLGTDGRQRYYRAAYQLPVTPWSTRLGVAHSQMRYRLGKEFDELDAHGRANSDSIFISQPLLRSRNLSVYGQVQYERQRLRDDIDLFELSSEKRLDSWTASLSANGQDRLLGGGLSSGSISYSTGRLRILDEDERYVDRRTARTAGRSHRINLDAARLQRLSDRFQLYSQASAQWAGGNLDSSQKFSLGGAYSVRAYPLGAASGDQGWMLGTELRYLPAPAWQLSTFVEGGAVQFNKRPWMAGRNRQTLGGAGVGALWTGDRRQIGMSLAWRIGRYDEATGPERSPRIWLQAAQYF